MPTTRKQKKARKSRGLEILSDIENLNVMLGENHFNETERDDSFDGTSIRRQESVISNNLENEGMNPYSNHRNLGVGTSADYGQNSASADSQVEINRLSSELNSRISREMDELMNNVSSQIQRAINDAISNQVLPQIQIVIMAGSGQGTRRGWERSVERPEVYPEVPHSSKARIDSNNEQSENHHRGEKSQHNVHDTNDCRIWGIGFVPNQRTRSGSTNIEGYTLGANTVYDAENLINEHSKYKPLGSSFFVKAQTFDLD